MSLRGNIHRPWQPKVIGNIHRVVKINFNDRTDPHYVADGYEDDNGFFIRSAVDAEIKYCPVGNEDDEAITKTFSASNIFVDPECCRKIFNTPTSPASDIYIGYGL